MPAQELGPDYRRLRAATVLGAAGDGLLVAALPLLAAGITRQPLAVAGVLAAQRLPWVLVALAGPGWAAHIDRRTAMGLLRTLRAVTIGAVGAGQLAGVEALPLLYLGAAVAGTAELVVDDLAADTAGSGAAASHRARAVGGLALVGAVATGIVGPPAGGALFRTLAALPFLADALASSLAALLLLLLRAPGPAGAATAPADPRATGPMPAAATAARDGRRPLRALAAATFLAGAGTGAAAGVLVLLALDELGTDPLGFGLLLAATAAGGLAGAWAAPELGRVLGAGTALAASLVVAAAGHGAVVAAPTPWAAGLALAVAGAGGGAGLVLVAAVRHAARPGRAAPAVERRFHVVAWSAVPVGAVAGGILADAAGVRAPFLLAAAALAGAAALAAPATRAARPAAAGGGAPTTAPHPVVRAGT